MAFGDFWNILWIPLLIPPFLFLYFRRKARGHVRFSTVAFFKTLSPSPSLWARHLLMILRVSALVLLVIALMRPREGVEQTRVETEGIDIVLSLDVSGSMRAEDFQIEGRRRNRLFVVKEVVRDFIEKRKNDRIGIVIFGKSPYTLCPLTLDQAVLLQFLERARFGIAGDATAIGEGITTSLNRLRMTKAKSKVIVLLTDGVQNAGKVDPQTAAELAKTLGIKIYTIGVGSRGPVPFPAVDMFGNTVYQQVQIDLDEKTLEAVAETTGGQYYRATDTERLKEIYREVDRLEKTKIETDLYVRYKELFGPFVLWATGLVLLEAVLGQTRLRTLP